MRYQIFSSSDNPILNITSFGYSADLDVVRYGPGMQRLYLIHYVITGKGYFNKHPVAAGQGFLITAAMSACYYPDEKDPWSFLWVVSDDDKMQYFFDRYRANPETHIFSYNTDTVLPLRDTLLKNNNSCYASTVMLEFFLRLFNRQKAEQPLGKSNAALYCRHARRYIESNLFRPIRITELTHLLGITQPYLYRIFMERFHMSPKQYINNCRVDVACRMLTETDSSVTEIANSVGYDNILDFSRFFKRQTGLSPLHYRKNH